MVEIKESVGDGGKNKPHDVALVQAALVLIKNPKGQPYLSDYDGDSGPHTIGAIKAFQDDNVRIGGWVDAGAGLAAAAAARPVPKPGLISPGEDSIKKINEMLTDPYKNLRVIEGSRIVYLPATQEDLKNARASVNVCDLEALFRTKVLIFVDEMYDTHGIAVSVTPDWADGGRRTFDRQAELLLKLDDDGNHVTNAGPGESNHNFGQAVDAGFNGLKWLRSDGRVVTDEDWWLTKLGKIRHGEDRAKDFWGAMRVVAIDGKANLYRGPAKDYPHIQIFSDTGLDMARQLAVLMNAVGKMKWSGLMQRYKCDLGCGGDLYDVGTAYQIWEKTTPVGAVQLAKARSEARKKELMKSGKGLAGFKPITATEIKAADVVALKQALHDDFQAAETNWRKWKA